MGPARSLRARLTLWYTAALGVLLVVLGATALGLLELMGVEGGGIPG